MLKKIIMIDDKIKEILEEIRENTLIAAKNNLTTEEAAKYIGVSPRGMRKLASAHVIAYSKPNNKNLYFNKADLEEYMQKNRVISISEAERGARAYGYG